MWRTKWKISKHDDIFQPHFCNRILKLLTVVAKTVQFNSTSWQRVLKRNDISGLCLFFSQAFSFQGWPRVRLSNMKNVSSGDNDRSWVILNTSIKSTREPLRRLAQEWQSTVETSIQSTVTKKQLAMRATVDSRQFFWSILVYHPRSLRKSAYSWGYHGLIMTGKTMEGSEEQIWSSIALYTRCFIKKNHLFSTVTLAFFGRFLEFSYKWKQEWILHNYM